MLRKYLIFSTNGLLFKYNGDILMIFTARVLWQLDAVTSKEIYHPNEPCIKNCTEERRQQEH